MIRAETAAVVTFDPGSLPSLVRRAASQLASATSAAEVLEARDAASIVYDAAKKAARMAKAKGAHDQLIAAAHRAQADALEIEAGAKRRLADEYDAAQERGEIAGPADRHSNSRAEANKATAADIGLTHKDIHEARQIRDAEVAQPGIARRALDAMLDQRQEPTKAALREAIIEVAKQGLRGGGGEPRQSNRNPNYVEDPNYRMLLDVVGPCRAMMESVDSGGIKIDVILTAFLDVAHRERSLRHIERTRDFLTNVLEASGAH